MINLLPIGGFWRLIAIIFLLSIIQQNLYATTPQEGRITHDLAELKPLWFSRATALGLARGRPNRLADRLNTSPANGKPQLVFQRGHSYLVHNATFSPNGNLYASSDTSGTILVWETKTGKLLRPLIGYTGSVRELVFDWSGALLASQGDDKIIRVWDVTSGTVLHSLEATCFDIAFRDASAHLLCSQSGEVFEWSWDDSQGPSKALVYKGASDLSLRWNKRLVHPYYPGGSLVSFKLDDKAIHRTFAHGLWEPTSKRLLIPSPDHIDERITFSRDGDLVASVVHESGEASYLRIWNIRTNEILRKILAYDSGVVGDIAISPNGRFVATTVLGTFVPDHKIKIWDINTGKLVNAFEGLEMFTFSPDSKTLIGTQGYDTVTLWDVEAGEIKAEAKPTDDVANAVEFTSDGAYLLWAGHSGNINVWDVGASRLLRSMKGHPGSIAKLVISPNGDKVAVSGVSDGVVSVWDLSRGTFLWAYVPPIEGMSRGTIVLDLSFTPDGQHLIYADGVQVVTRDALTGELAAGTDSLLKNAGRATFSRDHKFLALLSPITGPSQHAQLGGGRETARRKTILTVKSGDGIRQLDSFEDGSPGRSIEEIVFAPTGQHLAVLEQEIDPQFKSHRVLRIWPVKDIESSPAVFDASGLKSFSFSKDGQFIFASLTNGVVARITLLDNSIMKFTAETNPVSRTVTPNPDGTMLVAAGEDALLRVWKMDSEKVLCSIAVLSDGTWLAWSTDGRFDTNSLDKIDSFAWLMPDDPDRSLPAELYIRDYYSPKLVAALASGGDDALGSIRSIEQLNRARPRITNIRLIPEDDSQTIMAKVDVEGGTFEQAHNKGRQISGAYDLRLFRDGRLVAQAPAGRASLLHGSEGEQLTVWQDETQIVKAAEKTTVTFRGIELPHVGSASDMVDFSAYAFNVSRVKSDTIHRTTSGLLGAPARTAYIVAVGINDYGDTSWDLKYAVTDARHMMQTLGLRLRVAGFKVVENLLVSNSAPDDKSKPLATPNKSGIEDAIRALAKLSTPDDLVVLFFAGHGYSGERGAFYFLPEGSKPGKVNWRNPEQESLARLISAEEMAEWFLPIDAGEFVMIIDACQSAASIEGGGFRPGPLGNRGLGQLAYDKRMRVLAASQSYQAAREIGGQIGGGILAYALWHDGLLAGQAADGGVTTLATWLQYPVKRVPEIFKTLYTGAINDFGIPIPRQTGNIGESGKLQPVGALQVPVLFDYSTGSRMEIKLGASN